MKRLSIPTVLLLTFLIVSCAPKAHRPAWMDKRFNKPEILEGLGFAPVAGDVKAARDSAYNDAIQKMILSGSIQAKGYIETHLYAERGLKPEQTRQKDILDNVNRVMYDTVLDRKFFEEFHDRRAKEYWVYVYIPAASVNRITAEQTIKAYSSVMGDIADDLQKDIDRYQKEEQDQLRIIKEFTNQGE